MISQHSGIPRGCTVPRFVPGSPGDQAGLCSFAEWGQLLRHVGGRVGSVSRLTVVGGVGGSTEPHWVQIFNRDSHAFKEFTDVVEFIGLSLSVLDS